MFHSEFSFVSQRLFRYLLDVKLSDELFFIAGTNIVIKERKTTSALELSSSCCYWLFKSNPNKQKIFQLLCLTPTGEHVISAIVGKLWNSIYRSIYITLSKVFPIDAFKDNFIPIFFFILYSKFC